MPLATGGWVRVAVALVGVVGWVVCWDGVRVVVVGTLNVVVRVVVGR